MSFDPNGVGVANGNIFGFPVEEASADIVIIPIPWDVTASYKKGTSAGPKAILNASTQLDFFHPKVSKAYETKVFMTPISEEWMAINDRLNMEAAPYFSALETEGEEKASADYIQVINTINDAQHALSSNLEERTLSLIHSGKICGVLGGEHSTPLGLIKALDKTYGSFSVLQIDAHADLRNAYEGFTQLNLKSYLSPRLIDTQCSIVLPRKSKAVKVNIKEGVLTGAFSASACSLSRSIGETTESARITGRS